MEVLNALGPGQDEKVYERALEIELELRGSRVVRQRQYAVTYKGHPIGTFIPDMLIDDLVLVDPKVVTSFNENHIAQMLGYLAVSGLKLAFFSTSNTPGSNGNVSSPRRTPRPTNPRSPCSPSSSARPVM